jgi:hypothetical protein
MSRYITSTKFEDKYYNILNYIVDSGYNLKGCIWELCIESERKFNSPEQAIKHLIEELSEEELSIEHDHECFDDEADQDQYFISVLGRYGVSDVESSSILASIKKRINEVKGI